MEVVEMKIKNKMEILEGSESPLKTSAYWKQKLHQVIERHAA